MLGICIEAGMTCPSCEGYIPLNALVESIRCPACGTEHPLGAETWKNLLDDAVAEVPFCEEGEGSSSTIFSNYNYRLRYGRLHPSYGESGDDIPVDLIMDSLDGGSLTGEDDIESVSVRPVPEFCTKEFPGVVALVGEETALLPWDGLGAEVEVEGGSDPVAFQCPSCGGSLLVDGSSRTETCRFCDTAVTMPDGLWRILHPAKTVKRWFMMLDPALVPVNWESDIYGAVPFPDGDVFLALENDHGDHPVLTRMTSNGLPVWTRHDLEVSIVDDSYGPGPSVTPDGRILLRSENGRDLVVLAPDGSDLAVIEGGGEVPGTAGEERASFTMEGCRDITSMSDGSILLYTDRDGKDGSGSYFLEFARFDSDGDPLPVWPEKGQAEGNAEKRPGLLQRIFGSMRKVVEPDRAPYIEDVADRPARLRDTDVLLASGADGSLYLLRDTWLAAFDPAGKKRYCIQLQCHMTWGRPAPVRSGEIFILAETEDDRYQVLLVPENGIGIEVYTASVRDGGPIDDGDMLVLSSDGTLIVLGYGGNMVRIPAT